MSRPPNISATESAQSRYLPKEIIIYLKCDLKKNIKQAFYLGMAIFLTFHKMDIVLQWFYANNTDVFLN